MASLARSHEHTPTIYLGFSAASAAAAAVAAARIEKEGVHYTLTDYSLHIAARWANSTTAASSSSLFAQFMSSPKRPPASVRPSASERMGMSEARVQAAGTACKKQRPSPKSRQVSSVVYR